MKNQLIKCMVLMALLAISCTKKKNTTRTVIDGRIANVHAYKYVKEFTLTAADYGGSPTTYKGTIQKDGTFKIYFEQYIAQDVELTPFVRTIIAHPGDSIHVDINGGDIKFSGDADETNNALYHYTSEYYSQSQNDEGKRYFKLLDTANFRITCQLVKDELFKNRDEFITKYQPNDEVKKWTKNYINIGYYNTYLGFNFFYNYMNARIKKTPGFIPVVLKGYTIKDDDVNDIFNPTLLNAGSYKLISQLACINPKDEITKHFTKNALANELLTGFKYYVLLTHNDAENFNDHRKAFDTKIQTAFIKRPLLKYYAAVKKNLENPKIASDVVLKNIAGTPAMAVIDSIKNQGKVIYVDFWATWCVPCRMDMPYIEKLIKEYKGKPIQFVSICVDSPKDTWKLALAEMKLTSTQYYCDKDQSKSMRAGFKIEGIPYHLLIDKQGNIVESGNMLQARMPSTMPKIERLLN